MIISIVQAEYLNGYSIRFSFSDGTQRDVDFGNFLHAAKNPMTIKYLDQNLFRSFTIQHGDIVWNDYEMCLPIWDLHEGNI
ncbi:MAG: DUF2442 domain-containing protein [Cyclobacteriaceae bacterium]